MNDNILEFKKPEVTYVIKMRGMNQILLYSKPVKFKPTQAQLRRINDRISKKYGAAVGQEVIEVVA